MVLKILGIDAAFANVGLAMTEVEIVAGKPPKVTVVGLKLIHTEAVKKRPRGVPRSSDDLRRAREALHGIQATIDDFKPDMVVAEVPFGSQSARASWALGIIIGVLAAIPNLVEVTPREVKTATGESHADKDEMMEWAMRNHPEAPWVFRKYKGTLISVSSTNEHLADALAAVYAGLYKVAKERLNATV